MGDQSSCYTEFVVKIVPRREGGEAAGVSGPEAASETTSKAYDALIYTSADLPEAPALEKPRDGSPAGRPERIAGLPLAGAERVTIHWDRYRAYLLVFFFGEKAAAKQLRSLFRLGLVSRNQADAHEKSAPFEADGPFLKALLHGRLFADRPVRVWWGSDELELTSLPWELLLQAGRDEGGTRPSFVRGLPPEGDVARIPVAHGSPLRVAFIHDPQTTSDALLAALEPFRKPGGRVFVEPMTGPPREALHRAAAEGFELIHLVTDGGLSLANEGILYLRKTRKLEGGGEPGPFGRRFYRMLLTLHSWLENAMPRRLYERLGRTLASRLEVEKCPPGELSAALCGSRVGLLCLSTPKSTDTSPARIDSYHLPTVYRAFAAIGGSTLALPSVVAPSGATDEEQAGRFWQDFYRALAPSAEIEPALLKGLEGKPDLPVALFLRRRDGSPFKPLAPDERVTVEPTQLNAALQLSVDLVAQLGAQAEEYGELPESIRDLLEAERERQKRLKEELKPWV